MSEPSSHTQEQPKSRSNRVKIFSYCVNKLWLLFAAGIILLALVHITLTMLLPKIDRYRPEIIGWVETNYGLTIEVSKISAQWDIQGPSIILSDLQIKSEDETYNLLEVGRLSIYFDILTSLWDRRYSTELIDVRDADLKFIINRELGVDIASDVNDKEESELAAVSGAEQKDKDEPAGELAADEQTLIASPMDLETSSEVLFDLLFGQKRISIRDSNLKLVTLAGAEFDYQIDSLEVKKFEQIHQLSGQLAYQGGGRIGLITEVYGDPSLPDSYSEVYLNGTSVDIAKLPWLDNFPLAQPNSGLLSWQFWGTWRDKHWQQASGFVGLRDAGWTELDPNKATTENKIANDDKALVAKNEEDLLPQDSTSDNRLTDNTGKAGVDSRQKSERNDQSRLAGFFNWSYQDIQRGYLAVHNVDIRQPHQPPQALSEIYVKFERDQISNASWQLAAEQIELSPFAGYVANILPPSNTFSEFLQNSDLSLAVDRVDWSIKKIDDIWRSPKLSIGFSELSYRPWNDIPRLNGLKGNIHVDGNFGVAEIQAEKSEFEFGQLFRHAIYAERFQSRLRWKMSGGSFALKVEHFELQNNDFELSARAHIFTQNEQPELSLYSEIRNFNAANKSKYLPVGIMSDYLVSYLDSGVKSGQLPLIQSVVRGPLIEFPFHNEEGLFVAKGKLKDATYQYLPDWPIATQLDGQLLFEGNQMDITASNARSKGNKVNFARAFVEDLSITNPQLELELDVTSTDNSGRDFIKQSPISFIAEPLDELEYQGALNTELTMKVGLGDDDTIELAGKVHLADKASSLNTDFINVTKPSGYISFDDQGIKPSKINAQYRGQPLAVNLFGKNSDAAPEFSLQVTGFFPSQGIQDFLGQRWLPYLQGEAPFSALIEFSPVDAIETTRVNFQSELEGLAISLPGEFSKKNIEKTPINLSLDIAERSTGRVEWKGVTGDWYWGDSSDLDSNDSDSRIEATDGEQRSGDAVVSNLSPGDVLSDIEDDWIKQASYGGNFYVNLLPGTPEELAWQSQQLLDNNDETKAEREAVAGDIQSAEPEETGLEKTALEEPKLEDTALEETDFKETATVSLQESTSNIDDESRSTQSQLQESAKQQWLDFRNTLTKVESLGELSPGIRVKGEMQHADVRQWVELINQLNQDSQQTKLGNALVDDELSSAELETRDEDVIAGDEQVSNVSSEESDSISVELIELQVEKLSTPIADLSNVQLTLRKDLTKPWQIDSNSEQGEISLTLNESQPWLAKVKNLNLTLLESLVGSDANNAADENSIDEPLSEDEINARNDLTNENKSIVEADNPIEQQDKQSPPILQGEKAIAEETKLEQTDSEKSGFKEGEDSSKDELVVTNELQQKKQFNLLPLDFFDIDVQCLGCVVQEKDYGDVLLEIRRNSEGLDFFATIAKNSQHEVSAHGRWLMTEDGLTETQLAFELVSGNIGSMLKKWDLDSTIEDSSGRLNASVYWQGAPWEVDYTYIDGDLQVGLGKGYLSEISDESGRILSLFNLQSIIRKLTFDFKDVYKKGFFYDSINGSFQIRDGVISTENVSIAGNVADVKLYGETDIRNEQIEQVAVITPHLTSSFPVLAAWAVEPTTGILVYLLNKIMEPAVEVATRIDYRIHGSFDEVKVDAIETSRKKIKVEYEEPEPEPENEVVEDAEKEQEPVEDTKVGTEG